MTSPNQQSPSSIEPPSRSESLVAANATYNRRTALLNAGAASIFLATGIATGAQLIADRFPPDVTNTIHEQTYTNGVLVSEEHTTETVSQPPKPTNVTLLGFAVCSLATGAAFAKVAYDDMTPKVQ